MPPETSPPTLYVIVLFHYATSHREAFQLKKIKAQQIINCLSQLFSESCYSARHHRMERQKQSGRSERRTFLPAKSYINGKIYKEGVKHVDVNVLNEMVNERRET